MKRRQGGGGRGVDVPQPAGGLAGPPAPHTDSPPGISQETLLHSDNKTAHRHSTVAEGTGKISKAKGKAELLSRSVSTCETNQGLWLS